MTVNLGHGGETMAVEIQLAAQESAGDALEVFMNIYESGDDEQLIREFTDDMPVFVIECYIEFLKTLRENVESAGIRWASPHGDRGSSATMTKEQLGNAIVICETIINERHTKGGEIP